MVVPTAPVEAAAVVTVVVPSANALIGERLTMQLLIVLIPQNIAIRTERVIIHRLNVTAKLRAIKTQPRGRIGWEDPTLFVKIRRMNDGGRRH